MFLKENDVIVLFQIIHYTKSPKTVVIFFLNKTDQLYISPIQRLFLSW